MPTTFYLCVEDFRVKLFSESDSNYLMETLRTTYSIKIDKTGSDFCGLNLDWSYKDSWIDISMPQYVIKHWKIRASTFK